ncbi:hypothetical protein [Stratiformator vulcanicus]|uniref:Uncharacterized protein n=1 Tax=Stratiformator vulcanicus TaxID=2527980 RepID=A0A517R0F9_9PLAN|nr:hypothetical protein [Stratiformator vulcanicus]QDT37385.1 hypothetical protein Pan189_17590 [Stratiformator vulcanicus]
MPRIALIAAALLILVGIVGFAATGAKTSLIPAIAGVLIGIPGAIALKESFRMHAMHAAVLFGLLGALAPIGAWIGRGFGSPTAVASQAAMLVICAVFVALCVKSFIDVRRARTSGDSGE